MACSLVGKRRRVLGGDGSELIGVVVTAKPGVVNVGLGGNLRPTRDVPYGIVAIAVLRKQGVARQSIDDVF